MSSLLARRSARTAVFSKGATEGSTARVFAKGGPDPTRTLEQVFEAPAGSTMNHCKRRGPVFAFTRSSTAWLFDGSGLLISVGNDVPCFDHTLAGRVMGRLRIEGNRTNDALWCRDKTNAAWVKTNITAVKDATGLDGSSNSASTLTATAANGTCLQTVTKASDENVYSVYVKRKTGSGDIDLTDDNGTTYVTITGLSTASWTRYALPKRTQANPVFGFRIVTSGDEIEVDVSQLEAGPGASSLIITTSVAVERQQDLCNTTDLNFYKDGAPGTFYIKASLDKAIGDTWRHALEISDNTADNRILIRVDATAIDPQYRAIDGTVPQFSISPNNDFIDGVAKQMTVAYAANDIKADTDGAQAGTDTDATIPTGFLTLRIGARYNNTQPWYGLVEEARYYKERQSSLFSRCVNVGVKTVDKYIQCHVGSEADESFTDSELDTLANNYDWITINRGHGNRDRDIHQADCIALKNLNPNLKISTYVPMSFRDGVDTYGASTFLDSFFLRDTSEQKIEQVGNAANFYIDLGNAAYRQWMLDQITTFMESAPWDGVFFDNCLKIAIATDPTDWQYAWDTLIGQSKIDAYNAGLTTLLTDAKALSGVASVTWNGIARNVVRPNRSLEHLDVSDGAFNERFVVQANGTLWPETENVEDVDLMVTQGASGKNIIQFSNADLADHPAGAARVQLARYALGTFLLGWLPGAHYFKFGDGFRADQNSLLTENADPIGIKIGPPVGAYEVVENLYRRRFDRGLVYVNMEATSQTVMLTESYHDWSDGTAGTLHQAMSEITIASEDAAFLLNPGVAAASC